MTEQMQRCFENWRAQQPEDLHTLRQELAYKDGFADALKLMHTFSSVVLAGDVRQTAHKTVAADQAERVCTYPGRPSFIEIE